MKPSYSDKQRKKARIAMATTKRNKFNRGDVVRSRVSGRKARVVEVPGMPSYDSHGFLDSNEGFVPDYGGWERQDEWELDPSYTPSGLAYAGTSLSASTYAMKAAYAAYGAASFPPISVSVPTSPNNKPMSKKRKNKEEWEVGARVQVKSTFANVNLAGKKGTILVIRGGGGRPGDDEIGVEFDEAFPDGHGCDGAGEEGKCRWGRKHELELIIKKKKAFGKKIDLKHLDALVIADSVKTEIVSTLKQVENHDKIFTKWGLGKVIEYGRGMTFMFYGLPGTGKTYGANLIAKALGTDLLVITAAEIQSSEPGAANRNIEQAFKTAQEKGQVLFIDECDSLIFNREQLGMVLASEVNTLLTSIEKFEGVCILATNRISDMDAALERRISLIVEFPMPNKEQRFKIWKGLMPEKLPIGDVKVEDLAEHEISGGMIKNAVLAAARLAAAENSETLTQEHFTTAIKRVLSSKNLMGSRKGQRAIMDTGMSTGVDRTISRFDDYLKK